MFLCKQIDEPWSVKAASSSTEVGPVEPELNNADLSPHNLPIERLPSR